MFTSRFNRVLAAVTWLLCGFSVVAVALAGENESLHYLPLIALVAWAAWAGLWRPSLSLDDQAITVTNVFATTVVPWAALINVETKFALTLITPHRKVPVTVAPAPGRLTTALSNRDLKGTFAPRGGDGSIRPGDLPNTDSGAAAHLVRQRWQTLLAQDRIAVGMADSTPVERAIHWGVIAITVVLLVASVVALTLN
ncbi:MAG: PH domain-containing protein [Terrimesophilobacter sp.]